MTPAERIAWAVAIVRETRCVETAHTQTRVTSDVIRKACKAAGITISKDRQEISRLAMNAPRCVPFKSRPALSGKQMNEKARIARQEKNLMKLRGWDSNPGDTEEAAELVGINLHEPE